MNRRFKRTTFGYRALCLSVLLLGHGCSQGSDTTSAASTITTSISPNTVTPGAASQDENDTTALTTTATGTPESVHFVGRFLQNPNGPLFSWPSSTLETNFSGTGISVELNELGYFLTYSGKTEGNIYEILIDGTTTTLATTQGSGTYKLASGLTLGAHSLRMRKLTEAGIGAVQFGGFEVIGGSITPTVYPTKRKLLVIGDSLSAGYGVLGTSASCTYSPVTQSVSRAYGPTAADALDAEVHVIAWSGKGIARNVNNSDQNTMSDLYLRAVPGINTVAFDMNTYVPDAIAINLGTNDFSASTAPVQSVFVAKYAAMLSNLRTLYPKAYIFCLQGPILSDDYSSQPAVTKPLTTAKGYITEAMSQAGNSNMSLLEFPNTITGAQLGCDHHPNQAAQATMGSLLEQALKQTLSW